jgi:hypothetical protein
MPSTDVRPKRKWRWLKITCGIIIAVFLALRLLGSTNINASELELRRSGAFRNDDGQAVEVLNIGTKSIKINGMTINDRDDCKAGPLRLGPAGGDFPVELKVGDKVMIISSCRIIRAAVETDQGSNTYSFTGE